MSSNYQIYIYRCMYIICT